MNGLDTERAIERLIRFLSIEGTTGKEREIGLAIVAALEEIGVPAGAMTFDRAHERIPLPTECGNLLVSIEGTEPGPRRLFSTHRDTVDLATGARPQRHGDRIVSATSTALGGDDRAGVACLVTMVAELVRQGLPHPPLTLLFTVREESGLWGARCLNPERLASPALAFNVDGASPSRLFIGAVGGAAWEAEISGRGAHAGLRPEAGISAPLVVAGALARIHERGWWGRIRRDGHAGTSNVGRFEGRDGGPVGTAANVVTDYVRIEGEARSHELAFIPRIVDAYREALDEAAAAHANDAGDVATIEFTSEIQFEPFRMPEDSPLATFAVERARSVGIDPELAIADGGLDANWLVSHGIPTLTFGIGQRDVHTVDEWLDLSDYLRGCRLAIALATG